MQDLVERYRKVRELMRGTSNDSERKACEARMKRMEEEHGSTLLQAVHLADMADVLTGGNPLGGDPQNASASGKAKGVDPAHGDDATGTGSGSWGWVRDLLGNVGLRSPLEGFQAAKGAIDYLRDNPELASMILGIEDDGGNVEIDEHYYDRLEAAIVIEDADVSRKRVRPRDARRDYVTLHFHVPESLWSKLVTDEGEIDAGRAVAFVDLLDSILQDSAEVEDEPPPAA